MESLHMQNISLFFFQVGLHTSLTTFKTRNWVHKFEFKSIQMSCWYGPGFYHSSQLNVRLLYPKTSSDVHLESLSCSNTQLCPSFKCLAVYLR